MTTLRETVERARNAGATLLGIGPVSTTAILAGLEVAREMRFPVLFIASRNQVECAALGRGYVRGWTPETMVRFVRHHSGKTTVFFERDHGGPWQRDDEREPFLPEKEAFERALKSYIADLRAGFHLLHIDPTRRPGTNLSRVVEDTVCLMERIEQWRRGHSLPDVEYEIGTEEIHGGVMNRDAFREFLRNLTARLKARGLPQPLFVVGQTGTMVRMDRNAGRFNPSGARDLAAAAASFGIGFKEHNTDYLDPYFLRMHPLCGITSANVAPELGVVESKALLDLAYREEMLVRRKTLPKGSGFAETFVRTCLRTRKWKKWSDQPPGTFDPSDAHWRLKLTAVSGHYVFDHPEVLRARRKMMHNLRASIPDPEQWVFEQVNNSIRKYAACFGLEGLSGKGGMRNRKRTGAPGSGKESQ